MTVFFFYLSAGAAVIAALSVVAQRKTMSSALSLICCLGAVAMLYVLLDATFIAVIQVILYAGAIMVLFLFVIMLLDPASEQFSRSKNRIGYAALPLGLLLGLLIYRTAGAYRPEFPYLRTGRIFDVAAIGARLFSAYLLPFEATSILILVAILGAVTLAKKKI